MQQHKIKYEAWSILPANTNAKGMFTSHGCFRSECFAGVEHKSTDANRLLQICGAEILIAFAIRRKYELGLLQCFFL